MDRRKLVALLMALCMVLGLLPAMAAAEEKPLFDEPLEIRILAQTWAPYDVEMNDIWNEIERLTNVKLVFEWAPQADYKTKVATVLAAGVDSLPDMIGSGSSELLDQGAVVPLDDYLNQHAPNLLATMNEEDEVIWREVFDGQIYVLPIVMDIPGAMSTMIRTDWLKRVGKEIPTDWDSFIDVLRAFRDQDANGDGDPKNEIPFALDTENKGLLALMHMFGIATTNNGQFCVLSDGTYAPVYDHPNYQAFAEAVQMMNSEGLLDAEFATRKQGDLFMIMDNGTLGCTVTWAERSSISTTVNSEVDPEAEWLCIAPIKGPMGDQMIQARAKLTKSFMVTIAAEKRGKAEKIVQFVNWLYSEEGIRLMNFGIEGKHHKIVDGKPVLLPPYNEGFAAARQAGLIPQPFILCWAPEVYMQLLTGGLAYEELSVPAQHFYDGLFAVNNDYFFYEPPMLQTQAWIENQAEILNVLNAARDTMLSGHTTYAQFLAEYEQLMPRGMAEIKTQGEEAYKLLKGK